MTIKIDSSIPGWATRAKLVNIGNVASIANTTRQHPRILEIGVFAGRSMYHWAANAPDAEIVALDPGYGFNLSDLQRDEPETLTWMDGDFDKWNMWDTDILDVRKSVVTRHNLNNVDLRTDGSTEYLRKKPDPFDVIYIDGNHSTEQVYADISLSRTVLKPGGIICGDDYLGWPTVKQAVLNYKRENNLQTKVFEGMDMWVLYEHDDEFNFWFPNVVDSSNGIH